jgi:GGDEF domain-containing protein
VLPCAEDKAAQIIATRLITVFEDMMDACGGTEELGLRLGVGVSAWDVDATTPEEMIVNAGLAAAQAEAAANSSIHCCVGHGGKRRHLAPSAGSGDGR